MHGLGLNHTDKDTIAALQIEIARLQAEVERLGKTLEANTKANEAIVSELLASEGAARDDALEEAARALDAWHDIYGDNAAAAIRALKGTGE